MRPERPDAARDSAIASALPHTPSPRRSGLRFQVRERAVPLSLSGHASESGRHHFLGDRPPIASPDIVHPDILLVYDPRIGFHKCAVIDQFLEECGGLPAARGITPRSFDADDLDPYAAIAQPGIQRVALNRTHMSLELPE